jgi:hypothetical protein
MKPTKLVKIVVRKCRHGFAAKCPLGLWSVSGPDEKTVATEASRYAHQYLAGGEYDSLLNATAKPEGKK